MVGRLVGCPFVGGCCFYAIFALRPKAIPHSSIKQINRINVYSTRSVIASADHISSKWVYKNCFVLILFNLQKMKLYHIRAGRTAARRGFPFIILLYECNNVLKQELNVPALKGGGEPERSAGVHRAFELQ